MGFKTNKCCCPEAVPPYATLFVLNKFTGELEYKFPYVSVGNPVSSRMGVDPASETDKAYEIGSSVTGAFGTMHAFKWDIAGQTRDWRTDARPGPGSARSFLSDTYFVSSISTPSVTQTVGMMRRDDGTILSHSMVGDLMHVAGDKLTTLQYGGQSASVAAVGLRRYLEDGTLLADKAINGAPAVLGGVYPGLTGANVADRDNQYFVLESYHPTPSTFRHRVKMFDGNDDFNLLWEIDNEGGGSTNSTFSNAHNRILTDGVCGWIISTDQFFGGRMHVNKYCNGNQIYTVTHTPWSTWQNLPFAAINGNLYGYEGQARGRKFWRINGSDGSFGWIASHQLDISEGSIVLGAHTGLQWKSIIDNGVLYIGCGYPGVIAIDDATGYVLWQTVRKGFTRPVIDGDGLWTVGAYDNV